MSGLVVKRIGPRVAVAASADGDFYQGKKSLWQPLGFFLVVFFALQSSYCHIW
jgi:hypothetical protein